MKYPTVSLWIVAFAMANWSTLTKAELKEWLKDAKQKLNADETRKCHVPINSCKEFLDRVGHSLPNAVYMLQNNSGEQYPVYCHMTEISGCGEGGWTLVMTLDGARKTFSYNAPYWTNKKTYNAQDGLEGLTDKETKLSSYWNTPFTKICLGMKVKGVTKWIKVNYKAASLHHVFAGGAFRATNAGRSAWKSLVTNSSLQYMCNKEGFNVVGDDGTTPVRLRLGIIANEFSGCSRCDSFVGFGVKHFDTETTTGNLATFGGDNGDRDSPAIGHILVA